MRSRSAILFAMLAALTLFLFLLDLAVGAVAVPLGDVWAALTGGDCRGDGENYTEYPTD